VLTFTSDLAGCDFPHDACELYRYKTASERRVTSPGGADASERSHSLVPPEQSEKGLPTRGAREGVGRGGILVPVRARVPLSGLRGAKKGESIIVTLSVDSSVYSQTRRF
jgi:hypothetical protein